MEFVLSKWFSNKHLKEHPMLTRRIKLQNKMTSLTWLSCRVYTAPRDLVAPSVSRGLSQKEVELLILGLSGTRVSSLVQKHNLTSCQFHNKDGPISFGRYLSNNTLTGENSILIVAFRLKRKNRTIVSCLSLCLRRCQRGGLSHPAGTRHLPKYQDPPRSIQVMLNTRENLRMTKAS